MAEAVAIQGERGSYSEEAALILLPNVQEVRSFETFDEVFQATEQGTVGYCVVPIENSLAGSIYRNYDLLIRHHLRIVREVNLRIEHHLIALPGVTFDEIRVVLSHPAALDQCEKFFSRYPHLRREGVYDTSGSIKRIIETGRRDCAGIAGRRAAEVFGGQVLLSGIEDNPENYTRFFLLSREEEIPAEADKTSIVFSFKNAPGALFKCLSVFALRDIDLTKIESRPIHGRPWEYVFYLDFLGSVGEEKVRRALSHLEEITEFIRVLGSYPRDRRHQKKAM